MKKGKRPYRLSRRAFLQWLAGITGATIAAGTGLIKLGKGVKTVAPKVTEEVIKRGADGMPSYIYDLIEVVKAKGFKKIMYSNINKFPDTVHSYKGVDVTEDALGNIRIKKPHETGGTYIDEAGESQGYEGISHEIDMEITKGGYVKNKQGKMVKEGDEYIEGTVRPDNEGKMKDFEEFVEEADHLELKKIADEADEIIKKASGGRVDYDNYLPDIEDID